MQQGKGSGMQAPIALRQIPHLPMQVRTPSCDASEGAGAQAMEVIEIKGMGGAARED